MKMTPDATPMTNETNFSNDAFDAMLVAEECGRVLASVPILGLLPATAWKAAVDQDGAVQQAQRGRRWSGQQAVPRADPAGAERQRRAVDGGDAERVQRIRLPGLSAAEVCQLSESLGLGQLTLSAAERLRDHTGGQPLYIKALLEEINAALDEARRSGLVAEAIAHSGLIGLDVAPARP